MSLYTRPDTDKYWCKFVVNGRSIRRSTGTSDKERAEEFEAKLRASIYDQSRLGVKVSHTWNEAVVRYRKELEQSNKTHETIDGEIGVLIWLDKFLGGKQLNEIDRHLLDKIINAKQKDGVKPRTINTYTKQIRQVLRKAMLDWEWIDRLPKFRLLTTPKVRIRWLTRPEAEKLLSELPTHLRNMAAFSLETGLRRANVTGLCWVQVDLVKRRAWIHPDESKSAKAIAVPLSDKAVEIIKQCEGDHPLHIFSYKGNPVHQVSTAAWYKACARAGIADFRWHDLRHTWASWHIQDGTPLRVLQELGGWESIAMVQKYAHLSTDHLDYYVHNRNAKSTVLGTEDNSQDEEDRLTA